MFINAVIRLFNLLESYVIFIMMKLIDKYILKSFVIHFLFGIFSFVIIFILVDLFENLDKFIDKQINFLIIIKYYLYFIPEIFKLISPVSMLLASMLTINKFIKYSEITSIKSAGISIYRYLFPIFIFSVTLTVVSIFFNGWIVPLSNQRKFEIERNYLGKNSIPDIIQNIYLQDKANRIIFIDFYEKNSQKCNFVTIDNFFNDFPNKLEYRLDIESLKWDYAKNDWLLGRTICRYFNDQNYESLKTYTNQYISEVPGIGKLIITPELIIKKQLKPEELVLSDFKEFIVNLEKGGQNSDKEKVDYYAIISFPFANIVTIIFGVSISSSKRKGGAALHFGISLLVSFIYLGFVKISHVFGYNGDLNPLLTAWLGNIFFLFISLINFWKINKL